MAQLDDDNQGNILGERLAFAYRAENGQIYNFIQDNSIGIAVGNPRSSDADRDIVGASERRGLKLRYVNLEGTLEPEKKKRVVISEPANPLMTGLQLTVTINGVEYRVATVVGERRSRLRPAPNLAPPAP